MKKEYLLCLSAVLAVVFGIFGLKANTTMGKIAMTPTTPGQYEIFDFFSATTTNATSSTAVGVKVIAGATKATFFFSRDAGAGSNEGTSTFKVQVTKATSTANTTTGDLNWVDYAGLIANDTARNLATSTVLSAAANVGNGTSTKIASMDLTTDGFYGVRCIVLEQADGSHTCSAYIEW